MTMIRKVMPAQVTASTDRGFGTGRGRPKTERTAIPCSHCGEIFWRAPWRLPEAGAVGPLAGLMFCNRGCQKAHYRSEMPCCWPGCKATRLVEGPVHRRNRHSSFFCHAHIGLLRERFGDSASCTLFRRQFLAGEPMGHKRVTGSFVRFVVYELAQGKCAGCSGAVPRERFFIDHRIPVFEGGPTALPNLQVLCRPCHVAKTRDEQRRANATRWANSRLDAHSRMTHREKDLLIARMQGEIAALQGVVAEMTAKLEPLSSELEPRASAMPTAALKH